MFIQQHRTYDPKDAGSASDYAPFATVEDGGTRVVGPLEETRKLTTTLGVCSRKDMLRARRVIEARCVGLGRCCSVPCSLVCVCVCVRRHHAWGVALEWLGVCSCGCCS